jgi:DNA-binding MarR family transcriptional regulator
MAEDDVDRIRTEWAAIHPDLETPPIDIVGRILRSAAILTRRGDQHLARFGLTRGEFDILAALRRADAPQSPGALRTISLATGPATTKRLRALESRGSVQRTVNPADGRGALIALTPAGVELVDAAFPGLLAVERDLLSGVPADRRAAVVEALRTVMSSIQSAADPAAPTM